MIVLARTMMLDLWLLIIVLAIAILVGSGIIDAVKERRARQAQHIRDLLDGRW